MNTHQDGHFYMYLAVYVQKVAKNNCSTLCTVLGVSEQKSVSQRACQYCISFIDFSVFLHLNVKIGKT